MVASAELIEALRIARRAIEAAGDEVGDVTPWTELLEFPGRWAIEFDLMPAGIVASPYVPPTTRWVLIASAEYPAGDISLYPAANGGLEATFPHQLPNRPPVDNHPWREGKICTSEAVSGHPLAIARFEPDSTEERLLWHVQRALDWIRDASRGELLKAGEPYELPVFAEPGADTPTVAFDESAETFAQWRTRPERSGFVEVTVVPQARAHFAVSAFRRGRLLDVVAPRWGTALRAASEKKRGAWLRFDAPLVIPPWRAPWTWGELRELARREGRDLNAELRPLLDELRDGYPHFLMVGFPIPSRLGDAPALLHWSCAKVPPLNNATRQTPRRGYRVAEGRWLDDLEQILGDQESIPWVKTENWHSAQLGTRGHYEGAFATSSVALIGAGALGAPVGEMLIRGGVTDLAVIDLDALAAGNLVRHPLTLRELGYGKATTLADRLNVASPNANVMGFKATFPSLTPEARTALERAEIVIDTTGDDRVLRSLGTCVWSTSKTFASISFSYGAERLFAFAGRGPSFPSETFFRLFAPWRAADIHRADDMPWEGAGCWSSVFPARDDDVVAMAALACRHLDQWLAGLTETWELRVFERAADGTITRLGPTPPSIPPRD